MKQWWTAVTITAGGADLQNFYRLRQKGSKRDSSAHAAPCVAYERNNACRTCPQREGHFEIMKRYNVSDDRIVVFGDGLNDCSMFRPEWMTVAMGNAKPVLKKKAKYITDDADDDGIYNACRHFGWI